MNYKRFLAALTASLMVLASTSCGEDKPVESTSDTPAVTDTAETEVTEKATEKEKPTEKKDSEKTTEKKSDKTTEKKSDKTTEKKSEKTTAATEKSDKETKTTKATDKKEEKTEATTNAATTTKATEKPTEPPTEVPTTPNGKTYDAVIDFNETVSVNGVNAEANGSVVKITAGGDYIVRGNSSNGQIYISTATEEKVEITLDNVNISCGGGPAIFVNEAKRCVLKLAAGSSNYLSDAGNDKINDGVIFSNDTLRIKGDGYLEINAGNAHGIASDDDVIVESGKYLINSIKSGIIANDNITVNGGELTIFGGTNGMKSKGTMIINGGKMSVCGGVNEEKSSLYAASGLYYRGGYVYAAGNLVTEPAESPNPYIVASWVNGLAADTTVGLNIDGTERAAIRPKAPYRTVIMLSPDIYTGATFTPVVNGNSNGDHAVGDGQNIFKIE